MSFKYKMHLSFCFDAGTTNTSGLELLMNMFGGLGPGAGVPNNPDGYMPSSLSINTRISFCDRNLYSKFPKY